MDGYTLKYQLEFLLQEDADSQFIDDYSSFQLFNEAACQFVSETKCLKTYQEITTVAEQSAYDVNADFMGLYLLDSDQNKIVKYSDGTNTYFLRWKPYEEIIYENETSSVSIPTWFTIIDNDTLNDVATGTTTADGAASVGETTLTDSGGISNVSAGDRVHNTTDGSTGVVTSVTSSTAIKTALFGGTNNDWTSGDSYIIQPQGRYSMVLAPPPSTAAHTATLYYLQRPSPVYSDYAVFRIPSQYTSALVKYAAWLYKYRDREPNYGDKWYQYFMNQARVFNRQIDDIQRRSSIKVSWKAR